MAYNGWTNYETWNVALWLNNDEGLYRSTIAAKPGNGWDARTIEAFTRDLMPEGTPDFGADFGYDAVNWVELARSLNED